MAVKRAALKVALKVPLMVDKWDLKKAVKMAAERGALRVVD